MMRRNEDRATRRRACDTLALYALCVLQACSSQQDRADAAASNGAEPPATAAPGGSAGAPAMPGDAPSSGGAGNETVDPDLPVKPPPVASRPPAASEPAASSSDAGAVVGVPAPACARDVTEASQAVVRAAIEELFVQGDISAVDRYWGEPYLQHNPIAASGVTAFRNLFSGLISPGNSIYDLVRVVGECELVLIHGNYTSFGGPTFDMFRVRGGRLVEHWDAAAIGAGPNASGHSALDGETELRDVDLSAQNEALILDFVDTVLEGQAFDAIDDYLSPGLIEHSPESTDGSAAYVQHLQDRAISYRQVHHEIADGNFVFVLSEGAVAATDVAHYDLFRVEGSRIVEHWDGRREVPATTQSGLGIF